MSNSYYFDPCSVDGSDQDEVSLDNWRPSAKSKTVPKSQWRQEQIDGNYNQQPGLDELKKIHMYLKKKYPDHQIMDAFGISSETLVAIKRDCYSPVDGISLDNQSKIYKKFNQLDKKIEKIIEALQLLTEVFAPKDTVKRMAFKTLVGKQKRVSSKEKARDDEEE
jgi:hypothetical protein